MPTINEDLIRRQCIREHGEIMGSVLVEVQLTAIRKHAAEYEELERQLATANAALRAINASVPSLAPLRQAMDDRYQEWLTACDALEQQRRANEQAGSAARNEVSAVRQRMAEHLATSRAEGWRKSDLAQESFNESFEDQSRRRLINADSRQ